MIPLAPLLALCLLPQATPPPPEAAVEGMAADTTPAEVIVSAIVEDLRKGELLLDADALAMYTAHSFCYVAGDSRLFGQFAYLEPIRRARDRGDTVRELLFDRLQIQVFGASAVATYHFSKRWKERGSTHTAEGWSSDVFERRDDGAWLLVHRHRSR